MQEFEIIRTAVPSLVELGLAINTTTPISAIEPYLDRVEFIQCMGIARIGFQGEGFDERVVEHIRAIRALRPEMPISVDGAVNFETAKRLVEAGATRLVSGSAILKSNDVREAVDTFKDLVQ
jgi:ribulose-phosphate 3-epimerase